MHKKDVTTKKESIENIVKSLDKFLPNVFRDSYSSAKSFLNHHEFLRYPVATVSEEKNIVLEFYDKDKIIGDITFVYDGAEVTLECYTRGLDITVGYPNDAHIQTYLKTRFGILSKHSKQAIPNFI